MGCKAEMQAVKSTKQKSYFRHNPEDVKGSEKIVDAKTALEFFKSTTTHGPQDKLDVIAKKLGIDPELFKVTSNSRYYGQPGEQQGFTETVSVNGETIYSSSTTMSGEDAGSDDYSDKLEAIIQKQIKSTCLGTIFSLITK